MKTLRKYEQLINDADGYRGIVIVEIEENKYVTWEFQRPINENEINNTYWGHYFEFGNTDGIPLLTQAINDFNKRVKSLILCLFHYS